MKFLLCFACTIFCVTSHAEDFLETRIVGGSPSHLGQFPYVAGLFSYIHGVKGIIVCSGALLRNDLLITAAHCWFNGTHQAFKMTVILGTKDLYKGGIRQNTSDVIMHPDWNPFKLQYDVALIKISQPVKYSPTISAIPLPFGSQIYNSFAGEWAIASGFGLTNSSGVITYDQYLSSVQSQVITNEDCDLYFPDNVIQSNICTAGDGGTGSCMGDSGGPLVTNANGTLILIGITSFGDVDCESEDPSVYSRITEFLPFINQYL